MLDYDAVTIGPITLYFEARGYQEPQASKIMSLPIRPVCPSARRRSRFS